ncbi:hypothetical protein V8V75_21090, partial [Peribacillus frigoritolerans]|uniref:hypothetical protein n=1 Tax=Peribacillus frigoritolerans TaxID=450367 RepID=UPI00300820FB
KITKERKSKHPLNWVLFIFAGLGVEINKSGLLFISLIFKPFMDLLSDRHSIESKIQQNYPENDDFLLYYL